MIQKRKFEEMSLEEQQAIKQGLKDISEGRVTPLSVVKDELKEQELNELIAEWMWPDAKAFTVNDTFNFTYVELSDGEHTLTLDWFTRSQDTCGVLMDKLDFISLSRHKKGLFHAAVKHTAGTKTQDAWHEKPAMAFCLALEKLIRGKENG